MKYLSVILVLLLLFNFAPPTQHNDNPSLKSEARLFFEQYIEICENLRFNQYVNMHIPNAIYILNNELVPFQTGKKYYEWGEKTYAFLDIEEKQFHFVQLDENTCAISTEYFWELEYKNGKKENNRVIHTFNLVKQDNQLKVATDHVYYTKTPLLFSSSLPDAYHHGEINPTNKHINMIMQYNALLSTTFKFLENKDVSVKEYATYVGNTFKNGWNKEEGYEALHKGSRRNLQAMFSTIEILEEDKDHLTVRFPKDYNHVIKPGGTEQNFLIFYSRLMHQIAEKMNGKASIEEDRNNSDYLIASIRRK